MANGLFTLSTDPKDRKAAFARRQEFLQSIEQFKTDPAEWLRGFIQRNPLEVITAPLGLFGGGIKAVHGTISKFPATRIKFNKMGPHFGTLEQAAKRIDTKREPSLIPINPKDEFGFLLEDIIESPKRKIPQLEFVDLDIKNPLVLPDMTWENPKTVIANLKENKILPNNILDELNKLPEDKFYGQLRKNLLDRGYDGIQYWNIHEGKGWSFIPFKRKQIKEIDLEEYLKESQIDVDPFSDPF